jgi:predicted hydrolase (HD superfamily)
MGSNVPTREEALALLKQYNKNESLIKHAMAVEGVMRYIARKRLKENDWPEEYIRAVVSHGWGICSDVKPESEMEKVLYAIDELTGLVVTSALVRPSKSVMDMKTKSVKKKWKQKQFAAGVDRSIIEKGAEMLGVELSELITDTIMGMRDVAEEIGLKGNVE